MYIVACSVISIVSVALLQDHTNQISQWRTKASDTSGPKG
jgi:hypothetical protein